MNNGGTADGGSNRSRAPAATATTVGRCAGQLGEQTRCGVPNLLQLFGDRVPLSNPALGFGLRRAEQPSQILGETLNAPRRSSSSCHVAPLDIT